MVSQEGGIDFSLQIPHTLEVEKQNGDTSCWLLLPISFVPRGHMFLLLIAVGKVFPLLSLSGRLPSQTAKGCSHRQRDHFLKSLNNAAFLSMLYFFGGTVSYPNKVW